jgi:hypothetical protein
VRRTVLLALVLVAAGCGQEVVDRPRPEPRAAGPQRVELGWRETYPTRTRDRLVFEVQSFEVTAGGWSAVVAVTNSTSIDFETSPRRFGLMLFATGALSELEDANRRGTLPPPRPAEEIEPPPPAVLGPGRTWRGRLSASGSLPAGAYVRVRFARLTATAEPPEEMERVVLWITDRSYRLRP